MGKVQDVNAVNSAVGINQALSTNAAFTMTRSDLNDVGILEFTTGHASNVCTLPLIKGKQIIVVNNHASLAVLVKGAGGSTTTTIAATKKAILYCNGTEYVRVTADA